MLSRALFVLLCLLLVAGDADANINNGVKASNMKKLPSKNIEVHLKALNKITARADELVLRINKPLLWNSLQLKVRACYKSEAFEAEETTAFIEVDDVRGNKPQFIFSGWMFASSPAASFMDHGQYDVWLVKCVAKK